MRVGLSFNAFIWLFRAKKTPLKWAAL